MLLLTDKIKARLNPDQLRTVEQWERERLEREPFFEKLVAAKTSEDIQAAAAELSSVTSKHNRCPHDRSVWSSCGACEDLEEILAEETNLAIDAFLQHALDFVPGSTGFKDLLSDALNLTAISQRTLAKELEVIPNTIARWTCGAVIPHEAVQRVVIAKLRVHVLALKTDLASEAELG